MAKVQRRVIQLTRASPAPHFGNPPRVFQINNPENLLIAPRKLLILLDADCGDQIAGSLIGAIAKFVEVKS